MRQNHRFHRLVAPVGYVGNKIENPTGVSVVIYAGNG